MAKETMQATAPASDVRQIVRLIEITSGLKQMIHACHDDAEVYADAGDTRSMELSEAMVFELYGALSELREMLGSETPVRF